MPNEHAYERTPVGRIDIKELPEKLAYRASDPERGADEARRDLFMKNFQFLKQNQLKMTTPVERTMTDASMTFYVPRDAEKKELAPAPGVEVMPVPRRQVASLGLRGGYSEKRFHEGEERLRAWLADHPEWRPTGEPYAAYWDGPMMPAPLRRMEIHVPVERAWGAEGSGGP